MPKTKTPEVTECAGLIVFEACYVEGPNSRYAAAADKQLTKKVMSSADAVAVLQGPPDESPHHIHVYSPVNGKERYVVNEGWGRLTIRKEPWYDWGKKQRTTYVKDATEGIHKAVRMVLR